MIANSPILATLNTIPAEAETKIPPKPTIRFAQIDTTSRPDLNAQHLLKPR
jgi:hypothetical protein